MRSSSSISQFCSSDHCFQTKPICRQFWINGFKNQLRIEKGRRPQKGTQYLELYYISSSIWVPFWGRLHRFVETVKTVKNVKNFKTVKNVKTVKFQLHIKWGRRPQKGTQYLELYYISSSIWVPILGRLHIIRKYVKTTSKRYPKRRTIYIYIYIYSSSIWVPFWGRLHSWNWWKGGPLWIFFSSIF